MAKLTPAGVIGKWVVAPLLLLLLGYFVIGPRIGQVDPKADSAHESADGGPVNADPPAPPKAANAAGPDVDVKVEATTHASAPRRRRKKPSTPVQNGEDTMPKPLHSSNPSSDEGGSAGSTTAG